MNVAKLCNDNDNFCEVDDVNAIIAQLQDQVEIYKLRLNEIDSLFEELYAENKKPVENRDVNYLRDTVRSIARLFTFDQSDNDYPDTGYAAGFSGDIKGGGKVRIRIILSPYFE